MACKFTLPGTTVLGERALELCEGPIKSYGRKAFIVTGKIVGKSEAVAQLKTSLQTWGIESIVVDGITGEPTDKMVEEGVGLYRDGGCDFLIGIGGGSPLDSAKAIAAMSVLEGNISDYLGKEIEGGFPPTVLIPTTAGTGSEATKFTIITDTERDVKMLLKGDVLLPSLAVVDPLYTVSAPKSITAATGMDALTHAVESYTSRRANPLTDLYALDAIKRIFACLPTAYRDGSDVKAREELAIAAYEAGVCISNASVTIVHGMSRPIGALFHVPHGISNAMLIREWRDYGRDGCSGKFAEIARAIGAADAETGDEQASERFIGALAQLCQTLEIPTLEEYGIQKAAFEAVAEKMAQDAMASGSPANTIKEIKKEDILLIYGRLWNK
jgi:alcohol dehydrogenase class IV